MNTSKVKGLHKSIKKILNEMHPECEVEGHRVHTTLSKNDEDWPEWGVFVVGIGGGFVHFECEGDGVVWREIQKEMESKENIDYDSESLDTNNYGRCVPECGPIGFGARAA